MGVLRRHFWMPGGMHHSGGTCGCGGALPPVPLPSPRPPPAAPVPRPVCPRGPTSPLPLPLGPFPAPMPLSPCPRRGSRPLSLAPWPAPPAPVSFLYPCPCPWLRQRSPTAPRCTPCAPWLLAFAPCSRPCVSFPFPVPFPCSVSRVAPYAARALSPSAAAGLGALPTPLPSLLAACAQACPLRLSLGTPPVASGPPLRVPVAGTLHRLRAAPPLPDQAPGVLLPRQLRQRDAWWRTLGRRGADGPLPSRREGGLGGVGLGGADVRVTGVGVGAVTRALPALCCGCGGSRRGPAARAGATPCAGGVLGAAVGAAARLAGAAVSAPCAPGAPSGG